MRLFFIGDVFGRPGRRALSELLPRFRQERSLEFVVANGENAAAGAGISASVADEIFSAGVDVITGGNHIWDKSEGIQVVDQDLRILRPLNYPPETPGRGVGVYRVGEEKIAIISLMGRIYMQPLDCPFRTVDQALESLQNVTPIIMVDFHAEATSEKVGMGWYLDGRVSALFGTHTHVQTADERVLPRGTAYLTDAGMTGPHDSVIGVRKELALQRMRTQMPVRFQPAEDDIRVHGVIAEIDPASGRARRVERVQLAFDQGN